MKFFYYCYGRAHSSVIAGYIHLHRLPDNRIPSIKEILSVPEFDQSTPADFGIPYFLGTDHQGHEVYIIGFGKNHLLALQTINFILKQVGDPLEWRFFNALAKIDYLTKIGGFLSRNWKIVSIGRYLAALGIQRSYARLIKLVESTKEINFN